MYRALRVVRSGEMGYLRASKYFSVPRGTLERYVKDTSHSPEELATVHLGVRHNHGKRILWTETTGHKTHGFSVGNKKWFKTSTYPRKISSLEEMTSILFKKASSSSYENS